MNVAVVVASKHGSTREIAAEIAAELARAGHEAALHDVARTALADLDSADALVLGSALYFGHWLEPATMFLAEVAQQPVNRPVWLFSSGPVGSSEVVEPVIELFGDADLGDARGHEVFAGRLDRALLDTTELAVATALSAPDGDFRDWAAVRAWARGIGTELELRS